MAYLRWISGLFLLLSLLNKEVCIAANVSGSVLDVYSMRTEFSPGELKNIPETSEHVVQITACLNTTSDLNAIPDHLNMTMVPEDAKVIEIIGVNTLEKTEDAEMSSAACYVRNVTFRALRLGRSRVMVDVMADGQSLEQVKYDVTVIRNLRVADQVFNIMLVVMIVLNNIGFGCKFELNVAKEIGKRPVPLVIGFVCQYGLMPVIAFALGKLLRLPATLAFGLMATGAAPGGGQSNVWTILLDGDITLSICMTIISSFASIGMMPLWLLTLGKVVLQNDSVRVPFIGIFLSLLPLVIPLAAGLLINRFAPRLSNLVKKTVKPMAVIFILFLLTLGVYSNWYAVKFMVDDWRILVGGFLLPWTGTIVSGVVALICRQPFNRVKTISIETSYQNAAIALLVLKNSLVQPEADLTSVMPVTCVIATPLPFVFALIIKLIVGLCTRGKEKEEKGEGEEKDIKLSKVDKDGVPEIGMVGNFTNMNGNIGQNGQVQSNPGKDNLGSTI